MTTADSLAKLHYEGDNESSFHGHVYHAIKKENAVACSTHLDEGPTSSCHRVVSGSVGTLSSS
jgi:hypothetical protein